MMVNIGACLTIGSTSNEPNIRNSLVRRRYENFLQVLQKWLASDFRYHQQYPDLIIEILQHVIAKHINPQVSLLVDL
jgi:hypothetical protein